MPAHSFFVQVRDQPIYEFDLFGISGRTRNHPILVNTVVDLHAGLAHAGLFLGKTHRGKTFQCQNKLGE
jgi:hypothetical protein